jgi:hypothetical protein
LLFWFLRELTDQPLLATGSSMLFALWTTPISLDLSGLLVLIALAITLVALVRRGLRRPVWLLAPLGLIFVSSEIYGKANLYSRVIDWLPGRTASVMCLFALIALAAFARYERLSFRPLVKITTPLDPPATKGTAATIWQRPSPAWLIVALVGLALALGSYEQAIMLPALVMAICGSFAIRGYRPHWWIAVSSWLPLIGYFVLRHAVIPAGTSSYQAQALRSGPGVWLSLWDLVFPAFSSIKYLGIELSSGWVTLALLGPWVTALSILACVAAIPASHTRWRFVLTGYLMSVLAFLPMAWLQRFEHYYYLPSAFRAMFVVALMLATLDLAASAISPPAIQAPSRPDPAPGSLPRP